MSATTPSKKPVVATKIQPKSSAVAAAQSLKVISTPTTDLVPTNLACVPFGLFDLKQDSDRVFLKINDLIFLTLPHKGVEAGCIGLNSIQRRTARVSLNGVVNAAPFIIPPSRFHLETISIEVDLFRPNPRGVEIDVEVLCEQLKTLYIYQVFTIGQQWVTDFQGQNLILTATDLDVLDTRTLLGTHESTDEESTSTPLTDGNALGRPHVGQIIHSTAILLSRAAKGSVKLVNQKSTRSANTIFNPNFNFENLGIGGLDTEFSSIFRRAFASRIFPPSIIQKLGINHVKGILLYGPPGTGKTLMARQIGRMLNCKEPKVVNGPEILNKYVGQSEENIRNLFTEAEKEFAQRNDESDLHLIIFDELDAICRQRGTVGGGTGVHDSVVNQLLSKIDGVNALNNVLIIGMTNRRDLIDEALLRPGRFEVQMEIGLPDEKGRLQILRIHTKKMRENSYLADDVNLDILADETKNFSGAEIEGLVKSATSFAFNRQVDVNNISKPLDANNLKVAMADFKHALGEVKPAFGVSTDDFESYLGNGLIYYGPNFNRLVDTCNSFIKQVQTSERTNLLTVLLEGEPGSGKTALAANLALQSGFPFIKIISPETMVGFSEAAKCHHITKMFTDSYKSPLSVIVLDNIERIIEFVHIGPRFSNTVLQVLLVLLKKAPPKGRKLLVFGTTNIAETLKDMEITSSFNAVLNMPNLQSRDDMARVLFELGLFDEKLTKEQECTLPGSSELAKIIEALPQQCPIKTLLLVAEMAQSRAESSPVTADIFIRCLNDTSGLA